MRTSLDRVREVWGPRFSSACVDEHDPNCHHDMKGLLILVGTGPPEGMVDEASPGLRVKGRIREFLPDLADSVPPGPRT